MKWLLLGVPGIFLFTWATFAVQQQVVKRIDDKTLKATPKGMEWLSNGMNWAEQRYSTMTQINPQNVSKLALTWSYELGPGGGSQQATPLYSNGVLYTVTNWSIVAAVDAKTGKEIWRYDPEADRTMTQPGKSRLCCGVNSRGIALYEGKVLIPVVDGRMQALDAATGKLLWSSWAIPETRRGLSVLHHDGGARRERQSVHRQCRRRIPPFPWIRFRVRCEHRERDLEVLHDTWRSFQGIREQIHGSRSENLGWRMVEDGRRRIHVGWHGLRSG
jgi:outer membrane protein assembly factor BamB